MEKENNTAVAGIEQKIALCAHKKMLNDYGMKSKPIPTKFLKYQYWSNMKI